MSDTNGQDPPKEAQPESGDHPTRTCFLIARINDNDSPERRQTDGLLRAAIMPALSSAGFDVTAAHMLDQSGSISRQIIEQLLDADLVIADLTGHNPNVMYELGVRHAARKPVVILRESGTRIPFDVQGDRVVDYRNDFMGALDLQKELRNKALAAVEDLEPDNPVYAARSQSVMKEIVLREGSPIEKLLVDRLQRIEDHLIDRTDMRQKDYERSSSSFEIIVRSDALMSVTKAILRLAPIRLVGVTEGQEISVIRAVNMGSPDKIESRIRAIERLDGAEDVAWIQARVTPGAGAGSVDLG